MRVFCRPLARKKEIRAGCPVLIHNAFGKKILYRLTLLWFVRCKYMVEGSVFAEASDYVFDRRTSFIGIVGLRNGSYRNHSLNCQREQRSTCRHSPLLRNELLHIHLPSSIKVVDER